MNKFSRLTRPAGSKEEPTYKPDIRIAVKPVTIAARDPREWRSTEVSHEWVRREGK